MPGPESGDGREMETNGNPTSAANWHVMRVLRVDMVMRGGGMCDHMIVHDVDIFLSVACAVRCGRCPAPGHPPYGFLVHPTVSLEARYGISTRLQRYAPALEAPWASAVGILSQERERAFASSPALFWLLDMLAPS